MLQIVFPAESVGRPLGTKGQLFLGDGKHEPHQEEKEKAMGYPEEKRKMRLGTVQSQEVYDLIASMGIYRCDAKKSEYFNEFGVEKAYSWMALQMTRRIGPPPDGVAFPVWAWHTMDGKHQRPDMRRGGFRSKKRPFVLLEAEIDDRNVLLSDEELWHYVLNDRYLQDVNNETEYDEEQKRFDSLPKAAQKAPKEKSWEKIFVASPQIDDSGQRIGCYIQATFWELRKEHITKVWHYA